MISDSVDLSGRPLTGSSADQRKFVGRRDEFHATWQSLSLRANVLVLGRRGSGKTSFLRVLEAEIARSDALGAAVYVDAGAAVSLELLIRQIRWSLRRRGLETEAVDSERTSPLTSSEDVPGLMGLLQSLSPSAPTSLFPTTILLDEPEPSVAHTLFGRLRDDVWQLPFVWVVAIDVVDSVRVIRPPADAFFGMNVELGALSSRESVTLLHRYVDDQLGEDDLQRLAELGEGNPRRLISLARRVIAEGIDPRQLTATADRRARALAGASEPARRLADYLADAGPRSASDTDLLEHFGWSRNRAVQVFGELADLGLVSGRVEKGGRRKVYDLTGE